MAKHQHNNPALWVKDPCWFPLALNWERGEFSFARTSRAELEKTAFLDNRVRFTETPARTAGLSEVRGILKDCPKGREQQPLFIFHTGFCCSTLLSRMLDRKGSALVLKEPGILTRLSGCKSLASENILANRFKAALETSLNLLNRPWGKKEKTILKVSNSDLVLLDVIQGLFPKSPMVFLYSDLKEFLLSVAKGGRPRRDFTKRLFANLQADQKADLPQEIWKKAIFISPLQPGICR